MNPIPFLLTLLALTLASGGTLAMADSENDITFLETFALANDRNAVLQELIPGTEDYYFFHTLHAQNTGNAKAYTDMRDRWLKRHGKTSRLQSLEHRQALLDYETNPEASLAYFREHFAGNLGPKIKDLAAEGETVEPGVLDPGLISKERFLKRALGNRDISSVSDHGLRALLDTRLNPVQRRQLLKRLRWPNSDNLVNLIEADLKTKDAAPFGTLTIHKNLTLAQLKELLARRPELKNQDGFIDIYLSKLAPNTDVVLDREPDERTAYYQRLYTFVQDLAPAHNATKAAILYHWLDHERQQGIYDKNRFFAYIILPRQCDYVEPNFLRENRYPVNLRNGCGTYEIPAVIRDEELVRDFLSREFVNAADIDKYKPYIRDTWLRECFAAAKLGAGKGDVERWTSMLTPSQLADLKQRKELAFTPDNPETFGPTDEIRLKLHVKNIPEVLASVYRLNPFHIYAETGQPVNLGLDLDGLVATSEKRITFDDPPERRRQHEFSFPELEGRGVWIIELVGNGISSRALVSRGHLEAEHRVIVAGHVFEVLDENLKPVPEALIWFGGKEYAADEEGSILIPFSTSPGQKTAVIRESATSTFASLRPFHHEAEGYSLSAGYYLDRESLIAGAQAAVLIRPRLEANRRPATLDLLEDVEVKITVTGLNGLNVSETRREVTLSDDAETAVPFTVPEDALSLDVTLSAKIENLTTGKRDILSDSRRWNFNQIRNSKKTKQLFLVQTPEGSEAHWLGQNGEPIAGEVFQLRFKHWMSELWLPIVLKTDQQGICKLGPLPGIESVQFDQRDLPLPKPRATWLPLIQTLENREVQLPVTLRKGDTLDPRNFGLFSVNHSGRVVDDLTATLTIKKGLLNINELAAGDYMLVHPRFGQTDIKVSSQTNRMLEPTPATPLHIATIEANEANDGAVRIQLHNPGESTRVHVFATRYAPIWSASSASNGLRLADVHASARERFTPNSLFQSNRRLGDEVQYILNRRSAPKFPGVMGRRPSLTLNPWAVSDTETDIAKSEADAMLKQSAANKPKAPPPPPARAPAPQPPASNPDPSPCFDFISEEEGGTIFALNLKPDENGVIAFKRALLGEKRHLQVVAIDRDDISEAHLSLPPTELKPRDLRMGVPYDPEETLVERALVTELDPESGEGKAIQIADRSTATFEAYTTIGDAWDLLQTLSNDSTLPEFSWLKRWPDLNEETKQQHYSRYACHELHLFLHAKDRPFFDRVVRPYLANKKDKTFVDHWLLEADLRDYLRPWAFAQLNVVEKILLTRRIDGQRESVARYLRDIVALQTPNPISDRQRFNAAIKSQALGPQGGEQFGDAGGGYDTSGNRVGTPGVYDSAGTYVGDTGGYSSGGVSFGGMMLRNEDMTDVYESAPLEEFEEQSLMRSMIVAGKASSNKRQKKRKAGALYKATDKLAEKADRYNYQSVRGRRALGRATALYRQVDPTREWAENNYYHLPIKQQNGGLIPVHAYWSALAAHDGKGPFLSPEFTRATSSFAEILLALTFLDLPFKADAPKQEEQGDGLTLTPVGPGILFHKELRPTEKNEEKKGTVQPLLAMNVFRHDDRWRVEDGVPVEVHVADTLVKGVVYGTQVVLTNPSSMQLTLDVMLRIPKGAIPLEGGSKTRGVPVQLAPYATRKIEVVYYFPEAGEASFYPVTVSQNETLLLSSDGRTMDVLDKPEAADEAAWATIAKSGSNESLLTALRERNLNTLNLSLIRARMNEKTLFTQTLDILRSRHVYNQQLWAYGFQHNDPKAIRDFIEFEGNFIEQAGPVLATSLLNIDPVAYRFTQHLEYDPLINARVHSFGERRQILNPEFHEQYHELMNVLAHKPALDAEDELAVIYYLALQDRLQEALERRAALDANAVTESLQLDYLDAWLALAQNKPAEARAKLAPHLDHPVDRWRERFVALHNQLEDKTEPANPESREERLDEIASTASSLEMDVNGNEVTFDTTNLAEGLINLYPMDLELLFSRQPFVKDQQARFRFVAPAEQVAHNFAAPYTIPAAYQSRNLMIEATGQGLRRNEAVFANRLSVDWMESLGRLHVSQAETKEALPLTYIKVYARHSGGDVRFYKDGYTDFRGRFDFVALSTDDLNTVERFAILVLHDEHGGLVKEVSPPGR